MLRSATTLSRNRFRKAAVGHKVPLVSQSCVAFSTAPSLTALQQIIMRANASAMDGAVLAEKLSENKSAGSISPFHEPALNSAHNDIFFQQSNDEFSFLRAKFDASPLLNGQFGETAEEAAEKAAQAAAMIKRQLKIEEAQLLEASDLYQETFKNLAKMGRGTAMKSAQKLMLQWYEPLVVSLKKEIQAIRAGELRDASHVSLPFYACTSPFIVFANFLLLYLFGCSNMDHIWCNYPWRNWL